MADTLRHQPVGEDSKGCRYYFFSDSQEDCRLYREEPPRKRLSNKQTHREHLALWDTVCTTLEEISDFAARLGASRNKSDKALYEFLTLELLPKLIDTVSARKKADERAAALEAMPKKRSSRLQVSIQPKWPPCQMQGKAAVNDHLCEKGDLDEWAATKQIYDTGPAHAWLQSPWVPQLSTTSMLHLPPLPQKDCLHSTLTCCCPKRYSIQT